MRRTLALVGFLSSGCYTSLRATPTLDTRGRPGIDGTVGLAVEGVPAVLQVGAGVDEEGPAGIFRYALDAPLIPEVFGWEGAWGAHVGLHAGLRHRGGEGGLAFQLGLEAGPIRRLAKDGESVLYGGLNLLAALVIEPGPTYGIFGIGGSLDALFAP